MLSIVLSIALPAASSGHESLICLTRDATTSQWINSLRIMSSPVLISGASNDNDVDVPFTADRFLDLLGWPRD